MSKKQLERSEAVETSKPPVINCHAHVFTSDYVPPHIVKTFIPSPFYLIFGLNWLVPVVKWWLNSDHSPYKWAYQRWHILVSQALYKMRIATIRYFIWGAVKFCVGVVIAASIFYEFKKWYFLTLKNTDSTLIKLAMKVADWLESVGILIITDNWFLKGILWILLLTFFPTGRNFLYFILTKTFWLFKLLPGKKTLALAERYINIVKLARYKEQSLLFSRLRNQYPPGSAMVVLPMDMEFMGAGRPPATYEKQMEDLAKIKANHNEYIHPFVFVDPRRTHVGSTVFLDYEITDGQVKLRDCFIKTYIQDKNFSGFKIYPALGYYTFDERLLPLWKYAADNNLPIMTHCIKGTIFYRGKKKKIWDEHPVFEQYEGNQDDKPPIDSYFKPLLFQQIKPVDVQEIFTHPMNYACLLKKEWLAKIVANCHDKNIHTLFGYNPRSGTLSQGLENLKICFGHFGGEDEWLKHHERDRDLWGRQLIQYPDRGIDFLKDIHGKVDRKKAENLWKYADWYSLICSLMIQHPNVYADVSYILHDPAILPLLRQTLSNEKLRSKVLYGTDYYVVRNHKSDKQMLAEMMCGLSVEDFDQIARYNPRVFLNLPAVQ